MKKVLIFGDSHVANLYSVYKKDNTDVELRFIPALGTTVLCMEFINDKLILKPASLSLKRNLAVSEEEHKKWFDNLKKMFHEESGGKSKINLKDFDSIVVYGGWLLPFMGFNWWELTQQSNNYSIALCSEVLEEKIRNLHGYTWINSLSDYAAETGCLYIVLNPYLNEKGLKGKHDSAQDLTTLQCIPDGANIQKLFLFTTNYSIGKT